MRSVIITRGPSSDEGTFGELVTDSGFKCVTGELPDRGNARGISCIPKGTYQASKRWSEKHKANLFHVDDVPNRDDVEIHSGNLCGDVAKSFASDVLGCILPGAAVEVFKGGSQVGAHELAKDQRGVTSSAATLAAFHADLGSAESFFLTIR